MVKFSRQIIWNEQFAFSIIKWQSQEEKLGEVIAFEACTWTSAQWGTSDTWLPAGCTSCLCATSLVNGDVGGRLFSWTEIIRYKRERELKPPSDTDDSEACFGRFHTRPAGCSVIGALDTGDAGNAVLRVKHYWSRDTFCQAAVVLDRKIRTILEGECVLQCF